MPATSVVTAATWFKDVHVFDSGTGTRGDTSQVLVKDGLIASVTTGDRAPDGSDGASVIDGAGKTLIPGLIDAHYHAALASISKNEVLTADVGYLHIAAGNGATAALHRGFTTVRDTGGPVFGLKAAIDSGIVQGPRIFPSGAMISQSGGHGDARMPYETPRGSCGHVSHTELIGVTVIADGVPEVLRGVREQLMHGASQIKMMAGGGVSSDYDPIDVTEYTLDEMRAAVEMAENYGTYVLVHAYTPRAVRQSMQAGVKCIDHGQLIDEATVVLMKEEDVWWSLQPFLDDADAVPETGLNRVKELQVAAGTDTAYELAKKHGVKVAWGTDTLFSPASGVRQGGQLAKMVRWYTPAEVLTMATLHNAELLAMSGPRNPYPGTLGVIEAGAHADVLLSTGTPSRTSR